MGKQLFEEALADVKRVKQVAEDNAKRAILDAVTPRVRDLIDQALLREHSVGEPFPPSAPDLVKDQHAGEASELTSSDPNARIPAEDSAFAAAISAPDAEGKVTLDIDAICSDQPGVPVPPPMFGAPLPVEVEPEYEINLESAEQLHAVLSYGRGRLNVDAQIARINERLELLRTTSNIVRSTPAFRAQIAQLVSLVEDTYGYVQEQITDPVKKHRYSETLEAGFKDLTMLQEQTTMSQKTKQELNEADVTLKLTGLPDDIDLDTVGVDLVTGEEEGDEDMGDEASPGDDLGDLDLDAEAGEEGGQDQAQQQQEARRLSDDTIVEIDEGMLRREIARLRVMREEHSATGGSETKPQSWGHGAGELDDFGGGKDEGWPTDAEIVDKSPSPGALPLGEADDQDLDEKQGLDEDDDQDQDLDETDMPPSTPPPSGMDELQDRRKEDQFGRDATDSHETLTWDKRRHEAVRRLNFEKKLQERAKNRAVALKREAARARARGNSKHLNELKKEYKVVAQRFNESLARSRKVSQIVAQATRKLQEHRSNSGAARSTENRTENAILRKKLAETNLFNAKLLYVNKVLQTEQLTNRQKAQVIKQLDSAKTLREAKLVYESLSNTLVSSSKPVNEGTDRRILGSGSRTTRPASTKQTLNEGYEAERWAQLAGITKR